MLCRSTNVVSIRSSGRERSGRCLPTRRRRIAACGPEQVPALLAAGFACCASTCAAWRQRFGGGRLHDGSARRDVAAVIEAARHRAASLYRIVDRRMIGQAFALNHGVKSQSLMLCDPRQPHRATRRRHGRRASAAVTKGDTRLLPRRCDYERWSPRRFKARNPARWRQIRDTISHHRARLSRLRAAIQNFDFVPRLPTLKIPTLVVCGADDQGTPRARTSGSPRSSRRPLRGDRKGRHLRLSSTRRCSTHHDGLARGRR